MNGFKCEEIMGCEKDGDGSNIAKSISNLLQSEIQQRTIQIKKKIKKLSPWHFLWIGIVLSEILTLFFSILVSFIFWKRISFEVILIGVADAFFVPLIVVPLFIIYFTDQTSKISETNKRLKEELDERKKIEEKLTILSLTDELTGLHNRRGFFTLAEEHLKLAKRLHTGLFLLYADIDNLKMINDVFDHKEGDAALMETANIFKTSYRESDIIARIGGDEFVVISLESSEDSIDKIAERIRNAIASRNAQRNLDYQLSISVGIAYCGPENPCSIHELLSRSDKLMLEKKKHKKNP